MLKVVLNLLYDSHLEEVLVKADFCPGMFLLIINYK